MRGGRNQIFHIAQILQLALAAWRADNIRLEGNLLCEKLYVCRFDVHILVLKVLNVLRPLVLDCK